MAEATVARLKLDSGEFDAKVQRAVSGLKHMEEECRQAGGTLAILEKDQLDYVKALGSMKTVATTTRGKLSELTSAFTELSIQYKHLTEEEKQGDFGKALSASLDQLKTRIDDTKKELSDVSKELNSTNGAGQESTSMLEQLASKFTLNIDVLKLYDVALKATKAALEVAKDAFFASEQNLDDWNRTVYSAESTYQAFLTSINTGDISGFLQNINTIVKAAGEAYDALDRLGTMKTIDTPQMTAKQSEIQRMQTMLRTGRYVAPLDGRSTGGRKDGQLLTDSEKQAIANNLKSAISEVAGIMKQEINAANKAIDALYKEQAVQLGMSNEQFKKGTATMAVFEENLKNAQKYLDFEREHTSYVESTGTNGLLFSRPVRDNAVNPYEQYKGWSVFKDDGDLYQRLIQEIRNRGAAESQYYSQVGQAYRGINRVEGIKPSTTGGSTPQSDQAQATKIVNDALLAYSQAIEKAQLELESGRITEADVQKRNLQAQEKLWEAYGKAYATYSDPKYKEAQDAAAGRIKELGGEVEKLLETQKAAQQAARELEAAQKKLAEADDKMAVALSNNDLKAYNTAKRQAATAQAAVERIQKVVTVAVEAGKENLPDVPTEITQTVNVETGEVSLPDVPTEVTQTVNVETGEVSLPEIPSEVTQTVNAAPGEIDIPELPAYLETKANVKPGTTELPALPESEDVPVNFTLTNDNLNAFIADLKTRIGESEVGTTLYNNLTAQLADAQMLGDFISIALKNGIDLAEFDVQGIFAKIFGDGTEAGDYIPDSFWRGMGEKMSKAIGNDISIDTNTGSAKEGEDKSDKYLSETAKSMKSAANTLSSVDSGVSSIFSGLEALGVKIPDEIRSVFNVVQGMASILSGIASLMVIISAKPFAMGGIVGHAAGGMMIPGNSFSGDNLRLPVIGGGQIAVNSGELILNQAQQNHLANALSTPIVSGFGGGALPYVEGEQIYLGLKNFAEANSCGEIIIAR